MSEDRNSCPRCADYDRVVEEVENLKQQRPKEVKSLLDDCEKTRSQLQKKVTTMTVVAAVTGAVLGKEFVDKVADYIDSFNNATGLNLPTTVGMSTPAPLVAPDQKEIKSEEEDEKEEDEKEDKDLPYLPGGLLPEYANSSPFGFYETYDDDSLSSILQYPSLGQIVGSAELSEPDVVDLFDMTDSMNMFTPTDPPLLAVRWPMDQSELLYTIPSEPIVVPTPSSLFAFLFVLPFTRTRRR